MKLPHADEIAAYRAAERLVMPKATGYRDAVRAKGALEVMRARVANGLGDPGHLPGADEVQASAELHPALANLESMYPATGSLHARLLARDAQLDLTMRTLEPFVAESSEIAEALQVLWHKQAEASTGPEHAEAKRRLAVLITQRAGIADRIPPAHRGRAMVLPVHASLEHCIPHLRTALITASQSEDPRGRLAQEAAVLASRHRERLMSIADQMGLMLGPAPEPAVPDTPHPRHNPRLRQEAAAVLEWMQTMHTTFAEHAATFSDRIDEINEEMATVNAAIEEITG